MNRIIFLSLFILSALGTSLWAEDDPFAAKLPGPKQVYVAQPQMRTSQANLSGIGIQGDKSFAVINNDTYFLNEEKNGIKVTKIQKGKVDILMNGSPETLELQNISFDSFKSQAKEETPEAETKTEEKNANLKGIL